MNAAFVCKWTVPSFTSCVAYIKILSPELILSYKIYCITIHIGGLKDKELLPRLSNSTPKN